MNFNRHSSPLFSKFFAMLRSNRKVSVFCHHQAPPSTNSKSTPPNYINHWRLDRAFSWALLATMPIGLLCPSKTMDVLFAICVVGHQQMGLSSVVTDYVRTNVLGGWATKAAHGATIVLSAATLVGLLYLVFADIGVAGTIRGIWMVQPKN